MQIMLWISIVIALLIAALLVFAATRSSTLRVQRSTSIHAPPEKIAALIDDFHKWSLWSPYEKLDPTMTKSFSGAARGKGAVYEWAGNGKAGAGRMEILETSPALIKIKLDFIKPFEGHNTAEFTLTPSGDSSSVTWSMHGPSAYMMKLMGIFMNFDKFIGRDFETGLANLKAVAET